MFPEIRRGRRESRESCRAKQVTPDTLPVYGLDVQTFRKILRECDCIGSCTETLLAPLETKWMVRSTHGKRKRKRGNITDTLISNKNTRYFKNISTYIYVKIMDSI